MNSISMTKINLPKPRFVDSAPLLIAGLREPLDENSAQTIPELWKKFVPFIGNIPHQINRAAVGLCIRADAGKNNFYYMAGCEVADFANLPKALSPFILPSQRYAVFAHDAHLSQIKETIDAVFDTWLPQANVQHANQSLHFLEYYGEDFNPHTGLGGMEIWLPILV